MLALLPKQNENANANVSYPALRTWVTLEIRRTAMKSAIFEP